MEDNIVNDCPNEALCEYVILPWQKKNRYSQEIHEVDPQFDHVISCDIKLRFDIDASRGSVRCELALQIDSSRCHMTSHDRTADQSHDYCNFTNFRCSLNFGNFGGQQFYRIQNDTERE